MNFILSFYTCMLADHSRGKRKENMWLPTYAFVVYNEMEIGLGVYQLVIFGLEISPAKSFRMVTAQRTEKYDMYLNGR